MVIEGEHLDPRPRRQPIRHHSQPVRLPAIAEDDPAQRRRVDLLLPQLVEAALTLRARYPALHLRAIGKADFPRELDELQERVREEGAEDHVEFLGYLPRAALPAHYAWCDVFAGPSTFEPGPGNVYLEAMACGRPVVACASGGTPEVVLDGRTGVLVPPGDPDALIEALEALAADANRRQRLGDEARRWVEERFTLAQYARRVERIYRDTLE